MGENIFRSEPYLVDPLPLSMTFNDFMRIYSKDRDNGRTMVLFDEPTEIREDLLRKLCDEKGLSFDEVRKAICESLFKDTDNLIEGIRRAERYWQTNLNRKTSNIKI